MKNKKRLTNKEIWFLQLLKDRSKFGNGFITPSYAGGEYYKEFKKGSGHSSTGSPPLLRLTSLGLAERNKYGHYRFIKYPTS